MCSTLILARSSLPADKQSAISLRAFWANSANSNQTDSIRSTQPVQNSPKHVDNQNLLFFFSRSLRRFITSLRLTRSLSDLNPPPSMMELCGREPIRLKRQKELKMKVITVSHMLLKTLRHTHRSVLEIRLLFGE